MIIYGTIGLQYCNVREYRNNIILCDIWLQDRDICRKAKLQSSNNDGSYGIQIYVYGNVEGTGVCVRKDGIVYKQEKIEGINLQKGR